MISEVEEGDEEKGWEKKRRKRKGYVHESMATKAVIVKSYSKQQPMLQPLLLKTGADTQWAGPIGRRCSTWKCVSLRVGVVALLRRGVTLQESFGVRRVNRTPSWVSRFEIFNT